MLVYIVEAKFIMGLTEKLIVWDSISTGYFNRFLKNLYIFILIIQCISVENVRASAEAGQADFINGIISESTENVGDWPGVETDWNTALVIKSNRMCSLLPSHAKAAASSSISPIVINGASTLSDCQRECEKNNNYNMCEFLGASNTCNAYSDANVKLGSSTASNSYAGFCMDHHDFAYDSDNWYKSLQDFTGSNANEIKLHGDNKIFKHYVEGYVTHVRLKFNNPNKQFAFSVYPTRSGKFTLAELVTTAGGSIASLLGENGEDNWRGTSAEHVPGYSFGGTDKGKFCEHVGFNYLNLLDLNGKKVGRHFSSKNRARVRIGGVIGLKVPCKRHERNYAFGVGLDYNNGQVQLSSGFIKTSAADSVFKSVEVQVAFMLKDTAFESEFPYVSFGSRPESNALFSSN